MMIHIRNRNVLATVASALALLLAPFGASQAQSDTHPLLSSRFTIDAGMYFAQSDFELTVKGSIPIDPFEPIDFETTLDDSLDQEVGSIQFTWRFGEKWSLWGQYMSFDDGASAVLDEDVEWGDFTFGAGTGIAAGMENTITRVYFGRHFQHNNDRTEFGIGFGAHILEIDAFIEGNAIINGTPVGSRRESVETSGALPNLGAWYIHAFSPKWAIKTRLDWLGADLGKYDGHIINFSLGINYQVFQHFGVGLNYNWLELDVNVDDDPWQGSVLSRSDGLFAYLSAYW